jgi:NADPH:quinone reductase-like Zn-dependent oxidoreductase
MQAIITRRFGGPEVLEVAEVEPPLPLPTEVLVRVHAVGINPVEPVIRSGAFPLLGDPPFILGWDISGVIEDVVPGVSRFRVGDAVFGMPFFPRPANAYAEFVAAPSRQLALKPTNLDHVHAAALPLAGLTAWQSLVDIAKLAAEQRILIHAGGGGVGHLAVQIARIRGAHVIATANTTKHDFVRKLGADEVLDYRAVDFAEVVHDVDVVFDLVGGDYGERSLRTLRPNGLLVTAVDRANTHLAAAARVAGKRFAGVTVEPDHFALEELGSLVEHGRLKPHVEHVFLLQQAAAAHALIERGGVKGKIVLEVPQR